MTTAYWQLPEVASRVAWRAHLEASPSEPDARVLEDAPIEYFGGPPDAWTAGRVVFAREAAEHCVTLVVEDLRTGEARRYETCAATRPAERSATDTNLESCLEPPSEGLREAWCALHPDDAASSDCTTSPGSAGGGSTSSAGAPATMDDGQPKQRQSRSARLRWLSNGPFRTGLRRRSVVLGARAGCAVRESSQARGSLRERP